MDLFIDENGIERGLGNLLPGTSDLQLFGNWPIFGEGVSNTPVLARSQWNGAKKMPHYAPKKIKNQLQTNMCNPFAIVAAMEALRRRSGYAETELSPAYVYAAVNNGVDQGSPLEPAMLRVINGGTVPTSVIPTFDYDPRQWPNGVAAIAEQYKVLEAWTNPTFENMMSAVHYDLQTVLGIYWGKSDRLDGDGWLASEPMGGIAGGHAVLGWLPVVRESARGLEWGIKCLNSWGPSWGMQGWFVVPEGRFRRSPFAGAWTPRSVMVAQGDIKLPPVTFPAAA